MHAIIRQGNGKYYVSAVFGYYNDVDKEWIVWDENRNRLVRQSWGKIIVVDSDQSNWKIDERGDGCVKFLDRILLESFLDEEQQPEYILEACREMDAGYKYDEIREIQNQKDIEDLLYTTNGFADAYVIEEVLQDDGTLYLRFDGFYDCYCQIEVWFSGDLQYDTSRMDIGCSTWTVCCIIEMQFVADQKCS